MCRGAMSIVVRNGHGDSSSNPQRDCILNRANTLEKGINSVILPPVTDKL